MDASILVITDLTDTESLEERVGGDATGEFWRAHDEAVRRLVAIWGGRELDRTDGFLLGFARVADAIEAAHGLHAWVAAHAPFPGFGGGARVGVHRARVEILEIGRDDVARGAKPVEVEGLGKPLAARVMTVARPGTTLLTRDAVDAIGATPEGTRLVSHGWWRLKGVAEPMELHQAVPPGGLALVPADGEKVYRVVRRQDAWCAVRDLPNEAPHELDRFVGREHELGALADAFAGGSRIVAVTGLPGFGKTRLATRFARTRSASWPGGVVWARPAGEGVSVTDALAAALSLGSAPGDLGERTAAALAARGPSLVVLDDLSTGHGDELLRLRERVPEAWFLVTSAAADWEVGCALPLGPMPPSDARELLVDRLGAGHEADGLVDRTGGVPLAIEVAARLVRSGGAPGAASGAVDVVEAALHDAWGLLGHSERALLPVLAAFQGPVWPDLWPALGAGVPEGCAALRRIGLLRGSPEAPELPRLVARFAHAELLRIHGADGVALLVARARETHATALAAESALADQVRGPDGPAVLARLDGRLPDLVAAIHHACAAGRPDLAHGAFRAAAAVLLVRGPLVRVLELADVVSSSLAGAARAEVLLAAGTAARELGRSNQAQLALEEAGALAALADAPRLEGRALAARARFERIRGQHATAAELAERAIALARAVDDRVTSADVMTELANAAWEQGRLDEADRLYHEAADAHRANGDVRGLGVALGNHANVDQQVGRWSDALRRFGEALRLLREVGDRAAEGIVTSNLGSLYAAIGAPQARPTHERCLHLARAIGHLRLEALACTNLGHALGASGDTDEAEVVVRRALELFAQAGDPRGEGHARALLGKLCTDRGDHGAADAHYVAALALHEAVGNARAAAITLGNRAQGLARLGDREGGLALLRDAHARHERLQNPQAAGWVLAMIGELEAESGSDSEALATCARAVARLVDVGDGSWEVRARTTTARVLFRVRGLAAALGALEVSSGAGAAVHARADLARARLRLEAGDREGAVADLDRAVARRVASHRGLLDEIVALSNDLGRPVATAADLPAKQRAVLLVTDVVDSTRIVQEIGDDAGVTMWVAHDRAGRDLLHAWRGREVDRTDGFVLRFTSVDDAVGFALAYHRALERVPLPGGRRLAARVGVHVDHVVVLETPKRARLAGAKPLVVEGRGKQDAARVMSLGTGGTTLLTGAAAAALHRVPSGTELVARGSWQLGERREPVAVAEVVAVGAPLSPLRSSPQARPFPLPGAV